MRFFGGIMAGDYGLWFWRCEVSVKKYSIGPNKKSSSYSRGLLLDIWTTAGFVQVGP